MLINYVTYFSSACVFAGVQFLSNAIFKYPIARSEFRKYCMLTRLLTTTHHFYSLGKILSQRCI